MSIDRYTKCILTVIALCLAWLSLGGPSLLPTAHAQTGGVGTDVVVAGWRDSNGVVWKMPTLLPYPAGTFVSDDVRKNWDRIHVEGMRLPVTTP